MIDSDEPKSRTGVFWLLDSPESTVDALYHLGDDGGIEIELLSALAPQDHVLHLLTIFGEVECVPVTLFNCHLSERRGGSSRGSGPRHERWWVQSAVENGHFALETEAKFDKIQFTMPHLAEWAGRDIVDWSYEASDDKKVTEYLKWSEHPPEEASVPGARIRLHTFVAQSHLAYGDKTVSQRQVFAVLSDTPMTYDNLWGSFVRPLVDLISLTSGEPGQPQVLYVGLGSEEKDRVRRGGYRIRRHNKPRPPTRRHRFEMLWTLADWDFADGISRWFALDAAAPAGTMLLSQARHDSGGWSTTRFLSAVGAAEALHRGLYGTAEPSDRHKQKLADIYTAVSSKHRDWLKWKLRYSHEKSLPERLVELIQDTGQPAWRLIHHPDPWAKTIVEARNSLAHGREEAVAVATDAVRLHAHTETLVAILSMRIMRHLGFEENRTSELTQYRLQEWADSAARSQSPATPA